LHHSLYFIVLLYVLFYYIMVRVYWATFSNSAVQLQVCYNKVDLSWRVHWRWSLLDRAGNHPPTFCAQWAAIVTCHQSSIKQYLFAVSKHCAADKHGNATWFTAGGCNPHRSLWRHWRRHNSETIRDREKRRPTWHHEIVWAIQWRKPHRSTKTFAKPEITTIMTSNLGSRWKLQKNGLREF